MNPVGGFLELTNEKGLDTTRYTETWRSGHGDALYRKRENLDDDGVTQAIQNDPGIRTGGRLKYIEMTTMQRAHFSISGTFFSNTSTAGDSGSPMFAWDSIEKKWVVIGAVNSSNRYSFTNYATFKEQACITLMQSYANPIVSLNGASATWDNQHLNFNASSYEATNNKDLILKGGGTITLNTSVDQQSGAIYFDSNQTYTFKSLGNETFSWKGGGLSVGENTIVDWNLKGVAEDGLHKVGKGTLKINVKNGGWLNLGEGKVILDPMDTAKDNSYAFSEITLVSGRGTLQLGEGKANLINPKTLFFHKRGGTLDLNGNDLTFNFIQATDNGAKIINTNKKQAKITIKKEWVNVIDMPISGSGSFLYHGDIGDNILIYKDGVDQEPCPGGDPNSLFCSYGYGENLLAFDGNIFNPNGGIEHINGKLVLQGHPVIHAYLPKGTAEHIAKITGDDIYSTPTRLNQEDWENRIFVLGKIDISKKENASSLILGRNASLFADIDAKETEIFFGGQKEIYTDVFDGEDVVTELAHGSLTKVERKFRQTLNKGISQKDDSFYFEGNITGSRHTQIVISNTEKNPIKFGDFEGVDKHALGLQKQLASKPVSYQVKLDSSSRFDAKHIALYGNNKVIFDTLNASSSQTPQSNISYSNTSQSNISQSSISDSFPFVSPPPYKLCNI